jgi:hypothetical protein
MAKLAAAVRSMVISGSLAAVANCGTIALAQAEPAAPIWSCSRVGGNTQAALLFRRVCFASERAYRAAGHIVTFSAETADPASVDELADAADTASDAIVDLAARPGGKRLLTQINRVLISVGQTQVSVKGDAIIITVDPSDGPAGCPTSQSIQSAMGVGAT